MSVARSGRGVARAGAGSVVFVLLTRIAARGTVSVTEERAFRAVNEMSPALHGPAWLVMQTGSLAAVPSVAAIAFPRHRATAIALALDGTVVWALCKLVKRIAKRGRPADHLGGVIIRGTAQRGGGYPSGHTAVSSTLATVGGRLLPPPLALAAWGTAALVGGARQYVGAHLPLDVIGGATLGLSVGALANSVLDLRRSITGS